MAYIAYIRRIACLLSADLGLSSFLQPGIFLATIAVFYSTYANWTWDPIMGSFKQLIVTIVEAYVGASSPGFGPKVHLRC